MKKYLVFLLFCWFSQFSIAQIADDFAPIGATWHYEETFTFSPKIGFLKMDIVGDTMIQGQPARLLKRDHIWCNNRPLIEFISYKEDSLFYFDVEANRFKLLIDFSADVGETWELELWEELYDEVAVFTAYVDSISYWELNNNDSLRIQHVYFTQVATPELRSPIYTIIENIGFTNGFMPFENPICDGNFLRNLRCYEDANLGKIQFSEKDCKDIYDPPRYTFLPRDIEKQWNVVQREFFEPITFTTAYRTGKDTVLTDIRGNSNSYVQLERTQDSTYANWMPTDIFLYELPFLSRVYQYNIRTNEAEILYDFNMAVGDSITYDSYCTLKVISIDSIELRNGEKRKRLILENPLMEGGIDQWMEGIGSVNGVLPNLSGICYLDGYGTSVNCYYENGEKIYNPNDSDCFVENYPPQTSLLQSNTVQQWNVSSMDFTTSVSTIAYRTGKDTFMLGRPPYTQIEYTTDSTYTNWEASNYFLREPAYTKEVYFLDQSTGEEILLYNFNMRVGNSMPYYDCTIKVVEIDSIELLNGELRKRRKVESQSGLFDYWIEGIGSTSGILFGHATICSTDAIFDLNCYFEDENKLFSSGSPCFVLRVGTENTIGLNKISLFPNPTTSDLQLDLSEITIPNVEIHISSIFGQYIKTIRATAGQVQQIEVSDLADGIYFLSLEKEGQLLWSGRFLKGE